MLKAEYVFSHNLLRNLDSFINSESDSDLECFAIRWGNYFRGDPELSFRLLKHACANMLTQIEKPRYLQTKRLSYYTELFHREAKHKNKLIDPEKLTEVIHTRPFGMIFVALGTSEITEVAFLREQVHYYTLRIALAAEIHIREHGSYPDKLAELKNTLGEIPFDPFYSLSKRDLQYRKENDGYVVWSVGDDEKDELGKYDGSRTDNLAGDDIGFRVQKNKPKKKQQKK